VKGQHEKASDSTELAQKGPAVEPWGLQKDSGRGAVPPTQAVRHSSLMAQSSGAHGPSPAPLPFCSTAWHLPVTANLFLSTALPTPPLC